MAAAAHHPCSHCDGTGYRQAIAAPEIEVEAIAEGLREACALSGGMLTGDGRTDERTAAALLGLKPKTLSNWRHTHRPLAFVTRNRRVLYDLRGIARWMLENGQTPSN